MTAYATSSELEAFLGDRPLPAEADRLLERASELLDGATLNRAPSFWEDPLPAELTVQQKALRNAACAQVEFWMETGEEFDIVSVPGSSVGIGALNISRLPMKLAPRARRILIPSGLLYAGVAAIDDTWG